MNENLAIIVLGAVSATAWGVGLYWLWHVSTNDFWLALVGLIGLIAMGILSAIDSQEEERVYIRRLQRRYNVSLN